MSVEIASTLVIPYPDPSPQGDANEYSKIDVSGCFAIWKIFLRGRSQQIRKHIFVETNSYNLKHQYQMIRMPAVNQNPIKNSQCLQCTYVSSRMYTLLISYMNVFAQVVIIKRLSEIMGVKYSPRNSKNDEFSQDI